MIDAGGAHISKVSSFTFLAGWITKYNKFLNKQKPSNFIVINTAKSRIIKITSSNFYIIEMIYISFIFIFPFF